MILMSWMRRITQTKGIPASTTIKCYCDSISLLFAARRRSSTTTTETTTFMHSALNAGFLPYKRGHAWQNGFLNQRLENLRRQQQQQQQQEQRIQHFLDDDRLLIFQHQHVYTLGRGADENNLIFLDNHNIDNNNNNNNGSQSSSSQPRPSVIPKLFSSTNNTIILKQTPSNSDSGKGQIHYEDKSASTSNAADLVAPNGATVFRVERGGEVTYHGPGVLVVYPLLDLRRQPYKQDLHWYLRQMEELVIQVLALHGIQGMRDEKDTGVWVNGKKIAAIGVSSSRWITTHGFALNISPDLSYFDTSVIIPCGIPNKGVTSMEHELASSLSVLPSINQIAQDVRLCFQQVFGVHVEVGDDLH